MALLFLKKGQDLGGAKWFGKVSTIVFYVLVIVLIGAPSVNTLAAAIMMGVMLAFNILAFSLYMREYMTLYKQRKQENDNS